MSYADLSYAEASTVEVIGIDGEPVGTVELPADIFDVNANIPLMHQVVVAQLAAARAGTHSTRNRGQVSGGGRKPYKQKGTGRARQGSIRAPQFTGGGVAHGPVPRDYTQRTPKKMKAAALRGALSDRARSGLIHVVESFVDGDVPRTKAALALLQEVTDSPRVLVVLSRDDEVNWLSLRNLVEVHLIFADQLNTYDVLVSDEIVFTVPALEEFLGMPAEIIGAEIFGAEIAAAEAQAMAEAEARAMAEADVEAEDAEPETAEPETAEAEDAAAEDSKEAR